MDEALPQVTGYKELPLLRRQWTLSSNSDNPAAPLVEEFRPIARTSYDFNHSFHQPHQV